MEVELFSGRGIRACF